MKGLAARTFLAVVAAAVPALAVAGILGATLVSVVADVENDFDRFRNAVLDGKPPAMPPWRDKVSDDDVKLLWAYVRDGG